MASREKPLIVIVGQTASGKTALALELAKRFNGEIIAADSRTVYRKMDIGTAKPTKKEQELIKHHLLDVVNPNEDFNAAEFKLLANQAISEIYLRGKIPILVGGTGLYIDTLIYDFKLGKVDKELRLKLETMTDSELAAKAKKLGIKEGDINFKNRRHLIRAVERGGAEKTDTKLRDNCLVLGVDVPGEELHQRIKNRINEMLASGLENEVRVLTKELSFDSPGLNTICYKEWQPYFRGEQSLEEVRQNLYKNTWQYARRQKTWFKRNQNIEWITSVNEAVRLVQQFLIQ